MATTIFKFQLDRKGVQSVPVQRGGIVRTVAKQGIGICAWIEVDPTAPMEDRFFEVYGTGHPIAAGERTYIGTVHEREHGLVWHIYELHHTL